MAPRFLLGAILGLSVALLLQVVQVGQPSDVIADNSGAYPAAAGDDVIKSLGKFRIVVASPFDASFAGCPGSVWDGSRLTSPLMSDPVTKIGRSAPHLDASAADTGGTAVGTAGTIISDASFSLVPAGFEGPAGSKEIHTEVRTLNMTGGGATVRAGTAAPGRPISPGEVEAQGGSDFPADSFFNVFVDVDLPPCGGFAGGTVYNTDPLLVVNSPLKTLPPKVVYTHDNSTAIPVFLKPSGALFGWLVLAGHGADFDALNPADVTLFNNVINALVEMPLPPPPPTSTPPPSPTPVPSPTPPPVGGISVGVDLDALPLQTADSSGPYTGLPAGVVAAVVAGAVALGAAWYARRRWLRHG